jgi:bifunctional DNA-binding transcriptional regulator/antitoxin component of YhaV-PrlF toxin-antitoxin module
LRKPHETQAPLHWHLHGVILPKKLLDRLKLKKGDVLFASKTPDGFLLTPYDPEVARQVKLGLEFMNKHRETFRAWQNE